MFNTYNVIKTKKEFLSLMSKGTPEKDIEDLGTHLRVKLTQGQYMLCDKDDIHILRRYKFCANRIRSTEKYYAMTSFRVDGKQKSMRFHTIKMNDINTQSNITNSKNHTNTTNHLKTIDHKNRNGLDNRSSNLRFAKASTQMINKDLSNNNTSGVTGVYPGYNKYSNSHFYVAICYCNKKAIGKKTFSYNPNKEGDSEAAYAKAVIHRKKIEREITVYRKALGIKK